MSSQTKFQGVEDVRDSIVKIVDSKGNFNGTGFIIEVRGDKYCITCHHCICRLNETYIERSEIKCSVEWMEELSDMNKDIAILKVKDCDKIAILKVKDCDKIKPA